MKTESGIIFGNMCCLFGIIALFFCESHSIWQYFRNKSNMNRIQLNAMLMEFIMNVLFLFPVIVKVSIRNNYFHPHHSEHDFGEIQCKIAMVMEIPFYVMGKTALYGILMYRMYKTFEGSMFHINGRVLVVLITLQSITLIPFVIANFANVFHAENKATVEQVGRILICGLEYDENDASIKLVTLFLPAIQMLIEAIVCIYLMYLFTMQLRKVSSMLLLMNVSDNLEVKEATSSDKPGSQSSIQIQTQTDTVQNNSVSQIDAKNDKSMRKDKDYVMSLQAVALKQSILGITALVSSLSFFVYGIVVGSADMMGLDIVVNTLSIHLMFSYCNVIWNAFICKFNDEK